MTTSAALRVETDPDFDVQFPPLPRTVAEVSALLAAEEAPDTERLAEITRTDPVVATAVLRRTNSAYYGVRRTVSDLQQAVFLLGFQEVCNLVLTTSMVRLKDMLQCPEQVHILEHVLRNSIMAAYFCQLLGNALDLRHRQATFAAGLLHNVGRLIFLHNVADTYEALWHTHSDLEAPAPREERAIFGIDHSQLGYSAAVAWNLPDEIATVARHYLDATTLEDLDLRRLTCAASIAATAASQLHRFAAANPDGQHDDRWQFDAPQCLSATEEVFGVSRSVPLGLIEGHAAQALEFARTMAFT